MLHTQLMRVVLSPAYLQGHHRVSKLTSSMQVGLSSRLHCKSCSPRCRAHVQLLCDTLRHSAPFGQKA